VPFSFVVSGSKICQRPLRKIIYSNWLLIYYERSTSERLLSPLYLLVNIPGALAWISTIRGYFLFVAITINPNDDVPIAIIHFYAWCLCWLFTNKNHRFVLSQMVDLVLVENIDTSRTGCQLSWQLSLFGTVEKQTSTPLVGSWTVLTLIFVVNDAAFACNVFVGGYCDSRRNELVNRGWIWPMSTLHNN
jgi:hypothetical protein